MTSENTILIGDAQIIDRAIERARSALEPSDASIGVGFAEGIMHIQGQPFTAAWCAVALRDGRYFLGGGIHVQLSDRLLHLLKNAKLSEQDIEKYVSDFDPTAFEFLVKQAALAMKNAGLGEFT